MASSDTHNRELVEDFWTTMTQWTEGCKLSDIPDEQRIAIADKVLLGSREYFHAYFISRTDYTDDDLRSVSVTEDYLDEDVCSRMDEVAQLLLPLCGDNWTASTLQDIAGVGALQATLHTQIYPMIKAGSLQGLRQFHEPLRKLQAFLDFSFQDQWGTR